MEIYLYGGNLRDIAQSIPGMFSNNFNSGGSKNPIAAAGQGFVEGTLATGNPIAGALNAGVNAIGSLF